MKNARNKSEPKLGSLNSELGTRNSEPGTQLDMTLSFAEVIMRFNEDPGA